MTAEDTTDIIPVEVLDDGSAVDLSNATLTYALTENRGYGETLVEKTDSDATVYTASSEIGSELESILSESAGLTASEATDLSSGRFVVELEPSELPSAGQYYEEIRAEWPSGRTFSDVVGSVTVERAATE
jgi:hypothetical protein